jgi:steroid delta-isomerase-like uncharacterized protein
VATTDLKEIARKVPEEIFNKGKLEVIDQIFTRDYVEHVAFPQGFSQGTQGFKEFVTAARKAFPDFRYSVEDIIAESDKVVLRQMARGTQKGEFLGIPATGKYAEWDEIHIARFAGGKIVEHWAVLNQLSLFQQLGIIPTPGLAKK